MNLPSHHSCCYLQPTLPSSSLWPQYLCFGKVSLCSIVVPRTHYVTQVDLKLTTILLPPSSKIPDFSSALVHSLLALSEHCYMSLQQAQVFKPLLKASFPREPKALMSQLSNCKPTHWSPSPFQGHSFLPCCTMSHTIAPGRRAASLGYQGV